MSLLDNPIISEFVRRFSKFLVSINLNVPTGQISDLYFNTIRSYILSRRDEKVIFFIPECIELFDNFPSELIKFYNLCPLKLEHDVLAKYIIDLYFDKAYIQYHLGSVIIGRPKNLSRKVIIEAVESVKDYIYNTDEIYNFSVEEEMKIKYINLATLYFESIVDVFSNAEVAIISDEKRYDNPFDKLTHCYINLSAYERSILLFKVLKEVLSRRDLARKCQLRQNANKTAWLLSYSEI